MRGLLVWVAAAVGALACGQPAPSPSFERIDAHAHVAAPPDAFIRLLERLNVRMVNVTLVDPLVPGFDRTEPQTSWAIDIARGSRGRIAWASTFDPGPVGDSRFEHRTIAHLRNTFEQGAVAVKMYKAVGMVYKSASGAYVMPDDVRLAPVLDAIAASGRTLQAHVGDPRSSWHPLDNANPHYSYFKANPAWHMFLHPERPSWEQIMEARDRMLEAHPNLRVIGCHLGSMEHDVDEIAKRLERFPNFSVDTAARTPDLARQPREKVRAFLIRYQDRVLWGTDQMELRWDDAAAVLARWESAYRADWEFFAGTLALPGPVLRKIFRENALRWMPALAPLPGVDEVVARYTRALGGEGAIRKLTSRGARGTVDVPTFGNRGSYEEIGAPGRFLRIFKFENYGVVRRCATGQTGWTEDPEYGVEAISAPRVDELRRVGWFQPSLELAAVRDKLAVAGRSEFEGKPAFEIRMKLPGGDDSVYWFDAESGLLLGVEATETAREGVRQRGLTTFEDYRPVDGVQVPHTLRYVSPSVLWIVRRQIVHNIAVDPSAFRLPE